MLLGDFLRFVRMDAHRRVNPILLFGKRNGGVELLRPRAGADCEKRRHARGVRTFEHGFAIIRKLREVNVCVGVDEFHSNGQAYFKRAPISTSSSGKPARTGRPSGPTEAAIIIPLDSTHTLTSRNLRMIAKPCSNV